MRWRGSRSSLTETPRISVRSRGHALCGQRARSLKSALHKRFVDNHLGGDVRQFTCLPDFHLLSHRLEVSPHSINTHRYAIDERERLRVFGQDRHKRTWNNVANSHKFLYFASLLRFVRVSVSVGNDWSMTKLANFRIPALESNGRRLAVANLAIPWTIVHASRAN